MHGGYYRPKGREAFRVWFPWKGKTIFINKYLDGTRLFHEEQAKRVLEKIRAEVDQGVFDPSFWGKDRSLLFERGWEVYQEQNQCGRSRMEARERIYVSYILPYFKGKNLKEIEEHHINDWWTTISKDFAPSYVKVIRATLRAFLNFHRVTRIKAFAFPIVKVPKKKIEWLRREEQMKVLNCIPSHHQPIFRIIMAYGCRPTEACHLEKNEIDWEKEQIIFTHRKNGKDNPLPILDEIKPFLKPQKVTHWKYVFCTATGQKYCHQTLYHIWIEASKKAHVKIIPLKNGTRHSLACQLLESGESPVTVSRILGNSPNVVMRSYGAISVQKTKEILSRAKIVQWGNDS